jgi:hypothetical protein
MVNMVLNIFKDKSWEDGDVNIYSLNYSWKMEIYQELDFQENINIFELISSAQ